jgi:hypothetical protein
MMTWERARRVIELGARGHCIAKAFIGSEYDIQMV